MATIGLVQPSAALALPVLPPALLAGDPASRQDYRPLVAELFGAGEQGLVIVPDYTRSLFQDAAMSIPAVVGGPVIKALDLSGRGNTVTFANVTLQQDAAGKKYLAFNGTDSSGSTAAINFTSTDKMTVWAGVTKLSDAAASCLFETSAGGDVGSFGVFAPISAAGNYFFRSFHGAATNNDALTATTYTAPITNVLSCAFDNSLAAAADSVKPRINGQIPTLATTSDTGGGGNFATKILYIGRRAGTSLPLNGRIYSLIIRGAASGASQIASAERYVAAKTGVAL